MATALKICPTCGVRYAESERFCPKDGMALQQPTGASTDLVGSVIADRYHILKRLAAGGMGRVYLAEHVKMGRQCAIKVLHPSMAADAEAIARFNREAANASRIDHPNVAAIYDFGETPTGLLYLAMQYIEGQTLAEVIAANGALPTWRAADIARQAAEGLHAAHTLGIVHRDLKPDNIMLTAGADGVERAKVLDFGIAKSTSERANGLTKSGVAVGTPEYMSPEQLAGEEVGVPSDVYSLALVAYTMLTGKLPFPEASTRTSIVMRLTEAPRSLAESRPDVAWPDELEAVLRRALDREPSKRHATARDFAYALQAATATMPMHATDNARTRPIDVAAVTSPSAPAAGPRSRPRGTDTAAATRRMWIIAGALAAVVVAAIVIGGRGALRRAHARAALQEGIAAFREGRSEIAKTQFLSAIADEPNDPVPHIYLSRLAREGNDLTTASAEGVKAVRLGPNNTQALRELATTLYATQNYAAARAFYVRVISIDPADHTSQGYLGCSLIQLGRAEEGMRWIQRAGTGTWSSCVRG
jgi:cytochrome c-type biogenesis protein CcmH/NrfG